MLIDACPQTRRNPHISFPAISLTGGAPTNQSLHPAVGGLDSLELFLHLCRSCEETLLENPSPNAARHIHPVSLSIGIDIMDYELKNRGHVAVERQQSNDGVAADCTQADYVDMRRLGTKQELRRNFRFTSILGFVAVAMGTWEVTLSATAAGLTNGGTGGMIWMFLGSFICFGSIVLSLAEMSSMAPTAGGQYHWRRRAPLVLGLCSMLSR